MEIAARELDSRLLVSLYAAESGFEVIAGQKWLLQKNAGQMPRGTWIFKTLTPGDAVGMERPRKLGHVITAIDEEMPGLGEGCGNLRWVSQRSVAAADAIFCMGEKHLACMAAKFPQAVEKLIITGNPRWDFLRPEMRDLYTADSVDLRRRFAPFILINTNIGLVNSAKNTADALIRSLARDGRLNLDRPEDRAFIDNLLAFERSNFAAVAPLVKRLQTEFPEHQIVLRPHPTESPEPYERSLFGLERVHIVREGPAAAWLSACEVLVHTSCTTATEAFALGKPTIAYQTLPSPLHEYFLSGALSRVARSEDEVVAGVKEVLAGAENPDQAVQAAIFAKFFAAQSGPLAADNVVREIGRLGAVANHSGETQWAAGILFRRKWWGSKFQRRIFPDFPVHEISRRLERMASQVGISRVPQVHRVGDGIFHIFPAGMRHAARSRRRHLPI